jgi:hypothetical protein
MAKMDAGWSCEGMGALILPRDGQMSGQLK